MIARRRSETAEGKSRGRVRKLLMPTTCAKIRETSAGGVELALALARFSGEVTHEVLVGVAQQVVAARAEAAEVQIIEDRDELEEPVLHLLAPAQLLLVVEVGQVDDVAQVVGLGELADDLVEAVAISLSPLAASMSSKEPPGGT